MSPPSPHSASPTAACPTPTALRQLLDETATEAEQRSLQVHLETCLICQRTLERLAAGQESWDATMQMAEAADAITHEPALDRAIRNLENASVSDDTIVADAKAAADAAKDDVDFRLQLPFLKPATKAGRLGRLAHYEVMQVVGKGGFGIVLKAFDEKLHRVVALKVLAPELAASGSARERFLREARAAAAVRHDNVVAIHAVDETPIPYLVMEFIDGATLQEKIDRAGPLPVKETLRIGYQIAAGLAAAHKQGLIHRDIKPGNILLENGVERVKITDFGLARAVDDATTTHSGVVAGTPMYMAPEQAAGETLDHRADLFSLGSTMYVMCTGRPPFRASGTMAVLKRVVEDTPRPIRELNPDIPGWLADIIARLHAKKPADRYASAQEIADVLSKCLAEIQLHGGVKPATSTESPLQTKAEPTMGSWLWRMPLAAWVGIALTASVLVVALFDLQAFPEGEGPGLGVILAGAATAYLLLYGASFLIWRWVTGRREGPEPRPWRIALGSSIFLVCTLLMLVNWARRPLEVLRSELFHSPIAHLQLVPPSANTEDRDVTVTVEGDGFWGPFKKSWNTGQMTAVPPGIYTVRVFKLKEEVFSERFRLADGETKRVQLAYAAPQEALPSTRPTQPWVQLFDKGLAGWEGDARVWSWKNDTLVGNTLLAALGGYPLRSTKAYRDFEIKFEARIDNTYGLAGVQFRGQAGIPIGPAKHLGSFYTSYGIGKYLKRGKNHEELQKTLKLGFNDFHIKCVGKRVTLSINGITTIDDEFAELPDEGAMAFTITGGPSLAAEATFRNIRLRDLSGWTPLFNGKDLTGWKLAPENASRWRVDNGLLIGEGAKGESYLFSERGDSRNFHLRVEVKLNKAADSGLFLRCIPNHGLTQPTDGYEMQIVGDPEFPSATGTIFRTGPIAVVKRPAIQPDAWFVMELIVNGNHLTVKCDGVVLGDWLDEKEPLRQGHLALQAYSSDTTVVFGKIEIKELP